MGAAIRLIQQFFMKNPDKIANVASAAGKSFGSVKSLVAWAKANPMNAALAAINMGASGLAVLNFLEDDESVNTQTESYKAIASLAAKIDPDIDDIPDDGEITLNDLDKYHDEISMIRRVSNRLGGIERLYELRAVLAMSDQHFELEAAVRRLSR